MQKSQTTSNIDYQCIANKFEFASKICAVLLGAALVLSTAATVILAPLVTFFSCLGGNLSAKFKIIRRNPVALVLLLFYAMLLIGTIYSTAPLSDILLALRKYSKLPLALMLFPIFIEKQWRQYAQHAFIGAILVLLLASYLRTWGYLPWGASNGVVEVFKASIQFNFLMAFAAYLCLLRITTKGSLRLFWGILLTLIVYTVLFRSIGRSGYFVLVGLLLLFALQKFQWRGLAIAAIGSTRIFTVINYYRF